MGTRVLLSKSNLDSIYMGKYKVSAMDRLLDPHIDSIIEEPVYPLIPSASPRDEQERSTPIFAS